MNIILQSDVFKKWLSKLKDKVAKALIIRRIQRMELNKQLACGKNIKDEVIYEIYSI